MTAPVSNTWRGDAPAVSQVTTVTVGGTAANLQVYSIVLNGKTVSFTAGVSDTNSTIAVGLQANLTASTIPEFVEIVWTVSTTVITATAATAGVNFTISSVTATGTGTLTQSTTTASAGPNDWSTPANWTQGRIPCGTLTEPVQANAVAVAGGSLTNGTPYYWVVTAVNSASQETDKSNEKTYTPSGGNDSATISWATVPGAITYNVYRSTTSGTYGATSLVTSGVTGLSYTDTGTALVSGQPPASNNTAGDNVYLTQSSVPIYYGLAQGYPVFTSLNVDASFTGGLGLPVWNTSNSGYYEYRQRYLQAAATTINIGKGNGGGCGRFMLDQGSTTGITTEIISTGTTSDQNSLPAFQFIGGTTTDLTIIQGSVGYAVDDGTTATITTVYTGYANSVLTDVNLLLGSGCTLTTVNQYGGTLQGSSNITTLNVGGGTFTLTGEGVTITTMNGKDGTFVWEGAGTITTLNCGPKFIFDCSHDTEAKTVTNATLTAGCTVSDLGSAVTWSNPFLLSECGLTDISLDLGRNIHLQRS